MDTAFTHLLAMLCDIADPRRAEGKLYGLPHVFLFSILAVMAGANSYRAIHSFIDVHLHRLKQTFGLNWRRAPAYTTVRGILQGVAAGDVEAVFRLHAQILNESAACQGMRVVAFDGKTLRGSFDKFTDTRPAHLVSAFAADSALVLGHLEIDDKSNEIPAVQRLLGELGLANSVVTVDALHCQKKTFERAAQRGLRLIAQVKANQPTLLGDVQRLCDEHEPIDRHETTDTARARHETRHIEVFDAGAYFHDTEWAPFIAAVIRVQRRRLVRNTATGLWNLASETSYHVSNAVFSAHAAGGAIRAHWGIENRHHYPRDVTMGEDACRVRKNPGILARIRSFAANIMRANNVANMTDARYRNAIGGLDQLFTYHTK